MPSEIGWLLDAHIQKDRAILWFKKEDGRTLRLEDSYFPWFYVLPKKEADASKLYARLIDTPFVNSVDLVERRVNLQGSIKKLLRVELGNTLTFKTLTMQLGHSDLVHELFDLDLLHVQKYLFQNLRVEPTSKVEVHYHGSELDKVEKIEDSLELRPPPFSSLYLDIYPSTESLAPQKTRDPIGAIEVSYQGQSTTLEGEEKGLLKNFGTIVTEKDPDFLIAPNPDKFVFPYLLARSQVNKAKIILGRDQIDPMKLQRPLPYWITGRISLDYDHYGYTQEEWGIAGLVERSRFSFLPPGIAARWTANRVNDSRVCYELLQRGYVIPKNSGYHEFVRPLDEVVERDRGGMIISPRIGTVHENVAEFDYESQYPNIIVREGLSFETVTPEGVNPSESAVLPMITGSVLERRLRFKAQRNILDKASDEWLWCEQRQNALKLILVCIYGTSGCCWNRFGNVLTFEEINSKSRETMLKTKDIVQREGFEVIYADTDSIFVKKLDSTRTEYERLGKKLGEEVGLPISLDHHYQFLLLLPLESDPSGIMEAQKHYFGKLMSGEILTRGIEIRRHDIPRFIKDFQLRLIITLFDFKSGEEVRSLGYERAQLVVTHALDALMENKIPIEDLVVSKNLRRPITSYKSIFPHVSAAIQLASRGKEIKKTDTIDFIYTDADHHNPLCRVAPFDPLSDRVQPDKDKYREMILDSAETVLSLFGFTREMYGFQKQFNSWIDDLREERRREISTEIEAER